MGLIELLILIVVAGICGSIGQAITGYSRNGCLISIALGFIGALVGFFLKDLFGLPELIMLDVGTSGFPVIWSILGSALFVAVISFLTKGRKI